MDAAANVDVVHVHQSNATDSPIDLLHLQGAATNVTLLRLNAGGSFAAEINAPLKFTGGSVPLLLGTSQSNVVSNLNAFYLEGARSSQFLTTAANSTHTHSQYLTTAALSQDSSKYAGTTTGMAGGSVTLNTAGISLSLPAYLTTAQPVGAYLTTAALSNHSHAFATTTTGGASIIVGTSNSAGVTIGVPAYLTTAGATNAITTARASNDGVGLATAATSVTWTVNSAGISLNAGAYLTTAANSTHSHGNPTLALTNLTGTTASASNGFTLSLSAAAPGAGGGIAIANGAGTISSGTAVFSNANGVSFGIAGQTVTASVNAGGGAAPAVRWACPQWAGADFVLLSNVTALTQRPLLFPFECGGNLTGGELHWRMSRATSGSNHFTMHLGVYSHVNATQLSLFGSTSAAYSNTATASISGVRQFEMGVGTGLSTLSQGQWVLGVIFSATATASMNYSLMGASTLNPGLGRIDQGSDQYVTYTSHFEQPFWGRYSTTTGALPGSIAQSAVIGGLSGASLPLPMNFTLASHY
jgi:hypothetical protein